MYQKPHDYQGIVEVKMSAASAAKYRARKNGNKNVFTFAPNNDFVLPDVIVNKKPITGMLFDGHFKRGGKEFLPVDLELVRVVYYKKISANETRPTAKVPFNSYYRETGDLKD